MMSVTFCVRGEPQGKGRPKFSTVNGHARARTPDKTVLYENLVHTEYLRQVGTGCKYGAGVGLKMRVSAYCGMPKSASKRDRQAMEARALRPTKKPDADNILKVIADSLNGVAYHDDAQIVSAEVGKYYSNDPRVVVTIAEAST